MNELAKLNKTRWQEVQRFQDDRATQHRSKRFPVAADYPLASLERLFTQSLASYSGRQGLKLQIDFIDRQRFGGDLAIKVPELLKASGAKGYIKEHIVWIAATLRQPALETVVERVETKGIYVNVTLCKQWLLASVQAVVDLGADFGLNDTQAQRRILVDYSSPNVAKVLHAGHIRSTIIGHVLANLHEGCGALVHRVNHINDFGGFGFILEGYRRFRDDFPPEMSPNQRLLQIYAIRRTLERHAGDGTDFAALSPDDRQIMDRYFPQIATAAELKATYNAFVQAADVRMARLESGDAEEVTLWKQAVAWSLADFQRFYDALHIHIDLTIGESFYYEAGETLINACLESGRAVRFTPEIAQVEIAKLDQWVQAVKITPVQREKLATLVEKDIGGIVVFLPNRERLVVRRADGRSIYATRDLGALLLRRQVFDPTDITYVVGQEQRVHFSRLFKAAEVMGEIDSTKIALKHIHFGFYVDGKSGKKLSSRNSVANVNHLLAASVTHFRNKYDGSTDQTEAELDTVSRQLAVGSLVFNDLKQDMKGAVNISSADLTTTINQFESSGGAYVVYSACRARSILRKYGADLPHANAIQTFDIDPQEAGLILKILQTPEKIAQAAEQTNPSILVRHLLDTAGIYNAYYNRPLVLKAGIANLSRLLITQAVQLALTNGLKLCHVTCPPKI